MRNFAFMVSLALLSMTTAEADPIYGIWQTAPGNNGNVGHVEVKECEDGICGTLVKTFDGSGKQYKSDNLGKNIIFGMKAQDDGRYSGGKVWAPDDDKTYKSHLVLTGDSLSVSGCVLMILCRSQVWTRPK